ncbi:MAG: hypothetical protein LBL71_03250 [Endomicrobium sp.]|jgi:hypothetical protein|nr:hypothetical protein [Endomicrobium sp.]
MQREGKAATFDKIVLNILPLLKNGTTPEDQTILGVLETAADKKENDSWILKQNGQLLLDNL